MKQLALTPISTLTFGAHTYATPVATTYTPNGEQQDAAWILEGGDISSAASKHRTVLGVFGHK